jgi:1-aminocyclopropane-1-carboxylate deaminase
MGEFEILAPPPSPVQELALPEFNKAGVRLLLKRDDLLGPRPGSALCGNKWRKLFYNLLEARTQGKAGLLSFGGAYSNHIAAVAEASLLYGFKSIGIIRGERTEPLNPTLKNAVDAGMVLHFVSRAHYRAKNEPDFFEQFELKTEDYCIIPEGGTNRLAVKGCADLGREITQYFIPDYVAVACGTGGTLAGLICGIEGKCRILGISVLKGDFHREIIQLLCLDNGNQNFQQPEIMLDYHHGGYAKWTPELIHFIRRVKAETGIILDPVYTGKLLFALSDMVQKGKFERGESILAVHTGGLQGIVGFESKWGISLT